MGKFLEQAPKIALTLISISLFNTYVYRFYFSHASLPVAIVEGCIGATVILLMLWTGDKLIERRKKK